MNPKRLIFSLAACLGLCAVPSAAQAQIYSWHDSKGALVMSDRPPTGETSTPPVIWNEPPPTVRPSTAPTIGIQAPGSNPTGDSIALFPSAPLDRSRPYDSLIDSHASSFRVRPELVREVIHAESGFNPRAVSPKGAMGLMQLMPATANELGVANAFDPDDNIRAGVAYLRQLLTRYQENEELALAAYNAGPAAVDRYGFKVPPFAETQQYVSRIRARTHSVSFLSPRVVYKTDGTSGSPRYSNVAPRSGDYEVVSGRR